MDKKNSMYLFVYMPLTFVIVISLLSFAADKNGDFRNFEWIKTIGSYLAKSILILTGYFIGVFFRDAMIAKGEDKSILEQKLSSLDK